MHHTRGSIGGSIVVGLGLFMGAFPFLWWNEGRAIRTETSLAEGASSVVSVPSPEPSEVNEGKLIHVQGRAETRELVTDPEFDISINAIALRRTVHMYQWQQRSSTSRTGSNGRRRTSYSYQPGWFEHVISSSSFRERAGHENPSTMPWKTTTFHAASANLGKFQLSPDIYTQMENYQPFAVPNLPVNVPSEQPTPEAPPPQATTSSSTEVGEPEARHKDRKKRRRHKRKKRRKDVRDDITQNGFASSAPVASNIGSDRVPKAPTPAHARPPQSTWEARGFKLYMNGMAYKGRGNPNSPQIGDIKVTYRRVPPGEVSVIAAQRGHWLESFSTSTGEKLALLSSGNQTASAMFKTAEETNATKTWGFRGAGFLAMVFGIALMLSPLTRFTEYIPILNRVVATGVSVFALGIAGPFSLLVIAIAWLVHRPLVGVTLLIPALALLVFSARAMGRRAERTASDFKAARDQASNFIDSIR